MGDNPTSKLPTDRVGWCVWLGIEEGSAANMPAPLVRLGGRCEGMPRPIPVNLERAVRPSRRRASLGGQLAIVSPLLLGKTISPFKQGA